MDKVSIIIPARNETYMVSGMTVLQRTVLDLYEKAVGEIEIIVAFDGPPYTALPDVPNLTRLEFKQRGTKLNINYAVRVATGRYILKTDAHCMWGYGFDEILKQDMEDNWIVTPRFRVLDAENWKWQDDKFYDYFFLPCPWTDKKMFRFKAGGHWRDRTIQRLDTPIDENMKLHGSAFFTTKRFFRDIGGYDRISGAGTWSGEDIELSLKAWLGPWNGKLMTNKNTWYAHMHKGGQRPRGWRATSREITASYLWTANYWMSNKWEKRVHDLSWLIERFSPVPTWPENWSEVYSRWEGIDESCSIS